MEGEGSRERETKRAAKTIQLWPLKVDREKERAPEREGEGQRQAEGGGGERKGERDVRA